MVKKFGLIVFIFLALNCKTKDDTNKRQYFKQGELTFSDSLWLNFATAIEEQDITFLLKNSLDTIKCVGCVEHLKNRDFFEANYIFNHHLKQLRHLKSLSDITFSTSQTDNFIRVVYTIKSRYAEEGTYGLIFTFEKKENQYLFQGMMTVP